ncbi:SDR family oxidoreductase [Amycolatopsis sp. CA-128772]|uniref:SDR family oxidoreductase n=1 Tax=Amycolatopsis sp. CA-128772 TaxID=2073159 RepID=UPI00351A5C9B
MAGTRISHVLDDEQRRRQPAATPLGRLAVPADVATVVAFCAGEDNSFMTGTTAAVDGGMAMY